MNSIISFLLFSWFLLAIYNFKPKNQTIKDSNQIQNLLIYWLFFILNNYEAIEQDLNFANDKIKWLEYELKESHQQIIGIINKFIVVNNSLRSLHKKNVSLQERVERLELEKQAFLEELDGGVETSNWDYQAWELMVQKTKGIIVELNQVKTEVKSLLRQNKQLAWDKACLERQLELERAENQCLAIEKQQLNHQKNILAGKLRQKHIETQSLLTEIEALKM
ncbi:hypothetical protein BJP34_21290 [Moorena producens PAL-8-15-08-1]|uniref:Uncharacterized protein n=1 Tax=Moorena producens PAL-8-15-08-1 TaxID=1458985 RepID=A0A1D8TVS1_9CYAN|nr:hypothetical protein [Moorena producens]AOX01635.1 hypothetical protein BJP34_21290 [Moorena producens PAL-8-15-08-1]